MRFSIGRELSLIRYGGPRPRRCADVHSDPILRETQQPLGWQNYDIHDIQNVPDHFQNLTYSYVANSLLISKISRKSTLNFRISLLTNEQANGGQTDVRQPRCRCWLVGRLTSPFMIKIDNIGTSSWVEI